MTSHAQLVGRRLRYTEALDLLLLRQIVSINPWARKKGEGWMTAALNLQEMPGFNGRVYPRSIRDRVNLLLDKFSASKAELQETGRESQEPQSEKEDLLMKCLIQKENGPELADKNDATNSELFDDIEIDSVEGNSCDRDDHTSKRQFLGKMSHIKEEPMVRGFVMNGQVLQVLPRDSEEESAQPVNSTTLEEIEHSDFLTASPLPATPPSKTGTQRKGRKRKRESKRDLMMLLLEKEMTREKERREELEIKRAELKLAQDRLDVEMKLRQKEIEMRDIREKKELEVRLERERLEMEQRRREMETKERRHKREMEMRQELHQLEMEQRKQEILLKDEMEKLAQEERRFYLCVLQKMNNLS